jgi:hypothetical protein
MFKLNLPAIILSFGSLYTGELPEYGMVVTSLEVSFCGQWAVLPRLYA